MNIFCRGEEKNFWRRPVVPIVLGSVVFGLAAGVVGALVAAAYFTPSPPVSFQNIAQGLNLQPVKELERVSSPVETAGRSLALFYPTQAAGGPVSGYDVRLPAEAIGAGLVLTSDGWIVTSSDTFASRPAKGLPAAVAVVGSRSYALRVLVVDAYSGTVFVKVDASNLPVVSFGAGGLQPGDSVFAFDAAHGPHRLDVVGFGDQSPQSRADVIRSSERLQQVLRLSAAAGVLPGSMLLDRQGEVVGIFAGSDSLGSIAVPFDAFSGVIGSVLRDQAVQRPLLGVNYLDLAGLRSGPAAGALLAASPDGQRPAVARLGPAAKAGLRAGDIIIAVGGEDVTVNNPLADLIAEYEPDSAVDLTVERDGTRLTVGVILGTAR